MRDRGRKQYIDIDQVPIASGDNPHEEVVRHQEQQKFWSLVAGLPARQKEALVLRVREGYPFEEVARVMGCTVSSAKASYHHAVGKLKSALGADRENPSGS